ncbi:hypothetical protein B0T14DRAFT_439603 [Immersiella caudata]|uniref:Zn(2)-C6 fungal-type domain-containing protein n=1 Tax=Immersiella caudata TaxID=314043 RepID=A0AA39WAS2_9PEZI|nr:hypothetical protein B0T14DRAFT_439603 [Immersiella caudata]
MARLRLGYTKSRSGCLRCKQRRVKCDEQQPCRACVRHNVECSLTASRSSSEPPSARTTRTASPATQPPSLTDRGRHLQPSTSKPLDPQLQANHLSPTSYTSPPPLTTNQPLGTPSDPYPYFAKFTPSPYPQPDNPLTTSWVSDLSLLHHFTTVTARTLFRTGATPKERKNLWKIDVPRIAFSPGHTFLLHEILATAAFHLAFLEPHNRGKYHVQATQHQTVAIQGVRIAVENITSENCHAIFAASSLFFISALAGARPDVKGMTVDDFVDVFLLVKGIGGVLDSASVDLKRGPFGKLFIPAAQEVVQPNLTLDRVMAQLDVFLERVRGLVEGDNVRAVVELEVGQLKMSIEKARATTLDPEYRVIASFPIVMTEGFVSLLRGGNQVAMALLGYYCVVVHATERGIWFTKGWGLSILQDIARHMESPWTEDSAWAMGWVTGYGAEQV